MHSSNKRFFYRHDIRKHARREHGASSGNPRREKSQKTNHKAVSTLNLSTPTTSMNPAIVQPPQNNGPRSRTSHSQPRLRQSQCTSTNASENQRISTIDATVVQIPTGHGFQSHQYRSRGRSYPLSLLEGTHTSCSNALSDDASLSPAVQVDASSYQADPSSSHQIDASQSCSQVLGRKITSQVNPVAISQQLSPPESSLQPQNCCYIFSPEFQETYGIDLSVWLQYTGYTTITASANMSPLLDPLCGERHWETGPNSQGATISLTGNCFNRPVKDLSGYLHHPAKSPPSTGKVVGHDSTPRLRVSSNSQGNMTVVLNEASAIVTPQNWLLTSLISLVFPLSAWSLQLKSSRWLFAASTTLKRLIKSIFWL